MAATTQSQQIPIILSLLLLIAPISWFVFEFYAILGFQSNGDYDPRIESISDLGVEYKQVHPLKHYTVASHRAKLQNFNFLVSGALFAVAQIALLLVSRAAASSSSAGLVRTLRFVAALLVAGGFILLGRVHGGPREKKFGTAGWHWNGLALVAVAGNVTSLLAGAGASHIGGLDRSTAYRALSLTLGLAGLYSYYRFTTLGSWNFQTQVGLWQRGTIYSVLAWEAVTAVSLLATSTFGSSAKAKRT